MKRNRGSPAWRSTAELDGGGARVYGGDCEARCGRRGSRAVFKGGGRGSWACVPSVIPAGIAAGRRGIRIPATSPVISGPLRSREGRGEEGADARGRLVRGGARVARLPARWGQGVGGAGGMRASGRWAGRVGAGNWPWAELGRSAALGKGGTGRGTRVRWAARLGRAKRERVLDWVGLAGLSAGVVWAGFGLS